MPDGPGIAVVLCTVPCTGTSYVQHALQVAGIPTTSMHSYRKAIRKPTRLDSLRRFVDDGRLIVCVTLVREPLAMLVSQSLWSFFGVRLSQGVPWFDEVDPAEPDFEWFRRSFHDVNYTNYRNGLLEGHFATEFHEGMGIDVLATPFPQSEGYAVFARDRATPGNVVGTHCDRLVVLRTDRIDEKLRTALCDAADGAAIPQEIRFSTAAVEERNKGASNKDKPYYESFVRNLRLPDADIRAIYDRPYARHFLIDAEREHWIGNWTARIRS